MIRDLPLSEPESLHHPVRLMDEHLRCYNGRVIISSHVTYLSNVEVFLQWISASEVRFANPVQSRSDMKPIQTPGAISWPELITSDLDGAVDFYKAVFDWEVQTMPMSTGMYAVGNVAGQPASGMMKRPEEHIPPYWGFYMTVLDVPATVEKAQELGATVIMDTFEAPEVGKMAVLQDAQDAVFSVIAYKEPEHEAHQREWQENYGLHGAFSWFELRVPDAEKAAPFYKALFGWDLRVDEMGQGPYHVITVGGDDIGGIMSVDPKEMPPHWGAYVTVTDLDKVNASIKESGGSVMFDPIPIPGVGRFSMFQDPQGAVLACMEYQMPEEA